MLKNFRTAIISATSIAALLGCSAAGPKFVAGEMESVSAMSSHVYILRESEFFQSGVAPLVKIDEKEVGVLRNGGYIVAKVDPGPHRIRVEWGPVPRRFKISTEAGKRHYVRIGTETVSVSGTSFSWRVAVDEIPEAKALDALSALNLSE